MDESKVRIGGIYKNTKLWCELVKRTNKNDPDFAAAVGAICHAASYVSKEIISFFKTYTLHDDSHLYNVCEWMADLLGNHIKHLTDSEIAVLLMTGFCHDLGMLVSNKRRTVMHDDACSQTPDWEEYFEKNPKARTKIKKDTPVPEEILCDFVRTNHHRLVKKVFNEIIVSEWDSDVMARHGIDLQKMLAVCQSHGEEIKEQRFGLDSKVNYDLCSVLLRISDALDYDSSRAPDILYRFLGLNDPESPSEEKSKKEYIKNSAGAFDYSTGGSLKYIGTFYDPQIEHEVRLYIDWIEADLAKCRHYLKKNAEKWFNWNLIPYEIDRSGIESRGYESGDFKISMDQNGLLDLLSGEKLYGDQKGVFVRELLQNAIDAISLRCKLDPCFSMKDSQISITVWNEKQHIWFRIEDNGIGMDKEIINKYFLSVGRSYYTDKEGLEADLIRNGVESGFTSASRFGIGLLSCFMDGKDNLIEVATRRFKRNQIMPTFRLDITGLSGNYYLTEVKSHSEGRQIHSAKGMENAWRNKPGTTVCVRTNALKADNSSFIKKLDKYVCFPEVNVHFGSTEGKIEYTTQGKLEAVLDEINPDFAITKTPTEYFHKIPTTTLESYQKSVADLTTITFLRNPCVDIQYWPLHRISSSEGLSGLAITVSLDKKTIPVRLQIGETSVFVDLQFGIRINPNVDQNQFEIFLTDNLSELADALYHNYRQQSSNLLDRIRKWGYNPFSFSVDFSKKESELMGLIKGKGSVFTAYKGIDVGGNAIITPNSASCLYLLLNGKYRPSVSLARDSIETFDLEAMCDLVCKCDFIDTKNKSISKAFLEAPEEIMLRIINERDDIMEAITHHCSVLKFGLELRDYVEGQIGEKGYAEMQIVRDDPRDILIAVALKQLGYDLIRDNNSIRIKSAKDALGRNYGIEFPPILFMQQEGENGFGLISKLLNTFSPIHEYSVWFRANRVKLKDEALFVYSNLISLMLYSKNAKELADSLNAELSRLNNLDGDPYNVNGIRILEGEIVNVDDEKTVSQ